MNDIKIEVNKQLVGIKILLCISIVSPAYYFLISIIGFFTALIYYDSASIITEFFLIIIFGGIITFFVLTLIGLNKGYRYSMITTRISLILWCFSILGLILVLAIFWRRLNLPIVQQYLHYGYGKLYLDNKKYL